MSSEDQKKVAIVTAGGSGMGAAAARKLADDGFRVAILSSSGKGEALAAELGGIGVTGSNQSNDDLKRLVDKVVAQWGRVDVLVNSAGHGPRAPILDITDEDWDFDWKINVRGTYNTMAAAVELMRGQPLAGKVRGRIVNVSSVDAFKAHPQK